MIKKLLGIFVCMLLLLTIIPTGEALTQDDVKIKISAGKFGLNIGRGIKFKVVNKGDEDKNFTLNLVYDYYFRNNMDSNTTENKIAYSNGRFIGMRSPLPGLLQINISIEMENMTVERQGICIGRIVIFNK